MLRPPPSFLQEHPTRELTPPSESWRHALVTTPFLKKERREAEVRTVLSRQKNDINILADKAERGFIYKLKRMNGVR